MASKNIMLNIHSIHKKTVEAILSNQHLKERKNIKDKEKVKEDLIMEVDNIVNNILINTADNYPQAPPSGGTPRMRDVITEIDRVDNPDNDLIFSSGIRLSNYVNVIQDYFGDTIDIKPKEKDYTGFIMEVVNQIIGVTQDNSNDERERTVFERFR